MSHVDVVCQELCMGSEYSLYCSTVVTLCVVSTQKVHPANPSTIVCTQVGDDANVMLNGFGTVVNALGKRAKPYLPQICGTIKWRLNNKAAKIRQQAADLIARIAPVLKACEEEQLLIHLGVVLYEYLGEEVSSTAQWGGGCCMRTMGGLLDGRRYHIALGLSRQAQAVMSGWPLGARC
jgi:hypothetical protein